LIASVVTGDNVLSLLIIGFVIALGSALLLIARGRRHARRYAADAVQRFHTGHVPRIGGLAVFSGMAVAFLFGVVSHLQGWSNRTELDARTAAAWALCLSPVLLAGLAEDFTQRVGVRIRLCAAALSGLLAATVLNLQVTRLDIPYLDALLGMGVVAMLFTVFAVAGLPHAINIIDGYNGLAGTVTVLLAGAMTHVALLNGDRMLASLLVSMIGATLGFLWWNYPRGAIFAGDGGAYLWGAMLAMSAIALVQRHAAVSPWFVMLLFAYPVSETLFSIYRKLKRGQSPGMADSMHFHQLIYKRLVRGVFDDDETRRMLMRNNRTSPYLWALCGLTVAPAVLFWNNTPVLMGFCVLFLISYISMYLMIVRFKVPKWMRR
jgi:UDP-GlcNAc:undecaprenyl-phosphate/decaprenyl-phosphate GlcNAc-1-phosphate transferase